VVHHLIFGRLDIVESQTLVLSTLINQIKFSAESCSVVTMAGYPTNQRPQRNTT